MRCHHKGTLGVWEWLHPVEHPDVANATLAEPQRATSQAADGVRSSGPTGSGDEDGILQTARLAQFLADAISPSSTPL